MLASSLPYRLDNWLLRCVRCTRTSTWTTNHGAFLLHRPLQEAMAIMTQYYMVVIDEVSMLTAAHFEHILALWKYADQLPCLVLLRRLLAAPGCGQDC